MDRLLFQAPAAGELVQIDGGLAFVPAPLPPADIRVSGAVQRLNDQCLLSLGQLRAIVPALPNPKFLAYPFLRREAILSSKIEGTKTEIDDLVRLEAGVNTESDSLEVKNYMDAYWHGIQQLQDYGQITRSLILEMHSRLFFGLKKKKLTTGEFRSLQNFIGSSSNLAEARFVPPPPLQVAPLMDDLIAYVNRSVDLPTLVQAALCHYQFETIHPFEDGNGRVGRLLIMMQLTQQGLIDQPVLYLSAYFERHRKEYGDSMLQVSQTANWEAWILFFMEGVRQEALDAGNRARQILDLREQWRQTIQSGTTSSNLLVLVDKLFVDLFLTGKSVKEALGVTSKGAQDNIKKLVSAGMLEEVTGNKRNRLYVATPIINLIRG